MNLLLAILLTQSLQLQPYGPLGRTFPPGLSTKVMDVPLTRSGQGFDCTGALSCLSWNGSALVESTGLSWSMSGTVPQSASTTLPTTASTGAAGPFSDANYYSNGSGADALDSTGDRWGCVSFVPTSLGVNQYLVSNGLLGTSGHQIMMDSTGALFHRTNNPTTVNAGTGNLVSVSGFNTACWWRTGTGIFSKLNLGTTATSAAAGTEVSGTAYPLRVGRYDGAGFPFTGKILHVVQGLGSCPTPPAPFAATCEGWATYQMKRQFGLIGSRGEEITFTRATTATNEVNGTVWNVPSGVPRITSTGMLVERASTNAALQSSTSCVANAVQTPWSLSGAPTCVSDVAVAPDGTTSVDSWTAPSTSHQLAQSFTTASSSTFAASLWTGSHAATGTAGIQFNLRCTAGTANVCTCATSDGSSCTAATSTSDCQVNYQNTASTLVRVSASVTCAAAITNPVLVVWPCRTGGTACTIRFWGAQVETGLTPTSYQPTAGTAVARNADVATVPTPAGLSPSRWCVEVTGTPFGGQAWPASGSKRLWSAGTSGTANSVRVLSQSATNVQANWFDNAATITTVNTNHAFSAGSAHRISAAWPPVVRLDGAAGGAASGGLTPMVSWPASILIGSSSTAGSEWDGYLRDLRIYRSPTCR